MYQIATLNKISPVGLGLFTSDYTFTEEVSQAHGIMVRSQDMLTMEFSPNLMAIARAGAGVNNIPLDRCSKGGIVVFNTPGANANAVKELVLAGMFLAARNIPAALEFTKGLTATDEVAVAVEKGKGAFAGTEVLGKTLGVIGLGAIGVLVANTAQKLGMEVIGYDPNITVRAAHELSNKIPMASELEDLLPKCDYITIHVPALPATKGMINSKRFDQMKPGVVLLNFSRDTLVNDDNLIGALKSGKVRKYVTDFPNNMLLGRDNVIAIPHLGASTEEAEDNCAVMAADQLIDYLENGNITNSVNYPDCSLGKFPPDVKARICIVNKNVPTVLGKITGTFANMNINIRDMVNRSWGDFAYTMLDVDSDVSEADLKKVLFMEEIIALRVIQ